MTLKHLAFSTAFLIRINLVVAYLLDARLALLLLRWMSFGLVCFVVAAKNLRHSLIWITILNTLAITLHILGDPPSSPSSYLVLDFIGSLHTFSIWKLLAVDAVIIALQLLAAFATYLDQIPGYRARWYERDHAGDSIRGPQRQRTRSRPIVQPDGPVAAHSDEWDADGDVGWSVDENYDAGDGGADELLMDVTWGDLKRAWLGEPPRNDADFNPA
ncbi:hypothetical protein BCR44DRAFT_57357 [Catenaria anguillulae PL171]|uniref:DUF1746 domain-containing protein n=1 Tax=Catenaria anguillulae PL171 TaxID=765915 RepID=A0A1Y2HLH6_9FUNG|nr:hypothetical protein BCR44DRAFT_57357 [Catenaria anguillulae PL171]